MILIPTTINIRTSKRNKSHMSFLSNGLFTERSLQFPSLKSRKLPNTILQFLQPSSKPKDVPSIVKRDYNFIVNSILEDNRCAKKSKMRTSLLNSHNSAECISKYPMFEKRLSLPSKTKHPRILRRNRSATNHLYSKSKAAFIKDPKLKEVIKHANKSHLRGSNQSALKSIEKIMNIISLTESSPPEKIKKPIKPIRISKKHDNKAKATFNADSPIIQGNKVHLSYATIKQSKTREDSIVAPMLRIYDHDIKLPPIKLPNKSPLSKKNHNISIPKMTSLDESKADDQNKIKFDSVLLYNHAINTFLRHINEFISYTFGKKEVKIKEVIKHAHIIGVSIATKTTYDDLKDREWVQATKEKVLRIHSDMLNKSNGIHVDAVSTTYKYVIGKGNNSLLVKSIMNKRWWWSIVEKKDIENANFSWTQLVSKKFMATIPTIKSKDAPTKICNHLENHIHISNKKALFLNLRNYFVKKGRDPFDVLPLTFHIKTIEDPEMSKFIEYYHQTKKEVWIMKPGEFTNRGNGIKIYKELDDIKERVSSREPGTTTIIQKYIENPLLINKRKFDIRCFALATSVNGTIKAYFYSEGYLRTSSKEFSIKNFTNKFIHLTNDAIQKNDESYGKYESANKLSYADLQKYIDANYADKKIDFYRDINTQLKSIIADSFCATYRKIDPNKRQHTFEIFGYDFMLDENFKVYLIEVNTNPCLEMCCTLLSRIIPSMVDNAFR